MTVTSKADYFYNLGNEMYNIYNRTGKLEYLQKAIGAYEQAVQNIPQNSLDLPMYLDNLSRVLHKRYAYTAEVKDLQQSIELSKQAVHKVSKDSPNLPACLYNLGNRLRDSYKLTDTFEYLQQAVKFYEQALRKLPKISPDLPLYLNGLGNSIQDRYERMGTLNDFHRAIKAYEQAVHHSHQDSPYLPMYLCNLSRGLLKFCERTNTLENLQLAIDLAEQAVQKTPPDSPDWPRHIGQLGSVLLHHYRDATGTLPDLQKAIDAYKQAIQKSSEYSPDLSNCYHDLGIGLEELYEYTGALDDLKQSIQAFEQAVQKAPKKSSNLPIHLKGLSAVLKKLFGLTGELEYLRRSIDTIYRAVQILPEDSPDLHIYLNDLGCRLGECYWQTRESKDLQNGIKALEKAIQTTPKNSPNLPIYRQNISNLCNANTGLREPYIPVDSVKNFYYRIKAIEKAIQKTSKDSPYLFFLLELLDSGLSERYERTYQSRTDDAINDLNRSIEIMQQILQKTASDSPELPLRFGKLATRLCNRYSRLGADEDMRNAITAYKHSFETGITIAPNEALISSHDWMRWAFGRQAWDEVEQAYDYSNQAIEKLLPVQLLRSDKETWLKSTQGVAAQAAYALAKNNQLQKAVVALEQGLARLLSEALSLDRADLEKLKPKKSTLYARYWHSLEESQQLTQQLEKIQANLMKIREKLARELQDNNDVLRQQQLMQELTQQVQLQLSEKNRSNLRAVQEKLETTINDIRQVTGYEDFLKPPTFTTIQTAAKGTTLVYIVATEVGGLALIVQKYEIIPVWLNKFTEEALQQTLEGYKETLSDVQRRYANWRKSLRTSIRTDWFLTLEKIACWLLQVVMPPEKEEKMDGYLSWRQHRKDDNAREAWFMALETITHWLWQAVMGPLIEALPPNAKVTLIPVGKLGLLPLHAAWTYDVTAPTGRRYALDALTISYAPNARALTEARKVAHRVTADRMLAVDEPKPVNASPLPSSEYEVQTVAANFAPPQIFRHKKATRQAILDALPDCNVLHCSCHGVANLNKPLESALLMANYEHLTVKDFLDLRLNGVRLATLSACETGMPGMALPDEVVNLPAGLLQAGVAGVAASLWSVDDLSTALLMTKFYNELDKTWQKKGTQASIAQPLNEAQAWLRDATQQELLKWVSQLSLDKDKTQQIEDELEWFNPDEKPYAHPYYWAAFGAVGQ